jgi:hypothetical protein
MDIVIIPLPKRSLFGVYTPSFTSFGMPLALFINCLVESCTTMRVKFSIPRSLHKPLDPTFKMPPVHFRFRTFRFFPYLAT